MALTLMPCGAHSLASALVSCATPPLARGVARHGDAALEGEQRRDVDDLAARAALDHVAAGARHRRNTLDRLTSITASQSSSLCSAAGAAG
jgi:hypothetical protein